MLYKSGGQYQRQSCEESTELRKLDLPLQAWRGVSRSWLRLLYASQYRFRLIKNRGDSLQTKTKRRSEKAGTAADASKTLHLPRMVRLTMNPSRTPTASKSCQLIIRVPAQSKGLFDSTSEGLCSPRRWSGDDSAASTGAVCTQNPVSTYSNPLTR